jgi:hypothetical protein
VVVTHHLPTKFDKCHCHFLKRLSKIDAVSHKTKRDIEKRHRTFPPLSPRQALSRPGFTGISLKVAPFLNFDLIEAIDIVLPQRLN